MTRNGLTLVEIVVASVVMIIAIIPLWGLLGSSHRQVVVSSDEVIASQIALEILEQIEYSGILFDDTDLPGNEYALTGDSTLNITPDFEIGISTFPEYLEPVAAIEAMRFPDTGTALGRIASVSIKFSSRDSDRRRTYNISTYINEQ